MKEVFEHIFIGLALILGTLVICFGLLCLFVACGVEAFGYELPSIEEPCGLSTEELEAVLKHDLKQYAQDFLDAEEEYEINACFLASIGALESGWGRYCFKPNNIFGFGRKAFDSVPDCIDYVAWYLRKNYLNENGKYYRGGTIDDIAKVYCPGIEAWPKLIKQIYGGMVNDNKADK